MVEQGNIIKIGPLTNRWSRRPTVTGWALNKGAHLVGFGIAAVFIWSAMLKLTGVSPIVELLRQSIPFLAEYPCLQLLGMAEVLIGVGLIVDKLSGPASALMILNVVCVLGITLLAPALVFAPDSHDLTTQGAFLTNYLILTLAGLLFLSWRQRARASE